MYIAIVSNSSNRITKFQEFSLEADADTHVLTYGGFVFDNTDSWAIPDMWINGEVVTELSSVSLADYQITKILINQKGAGVRIALLFGTVADGFIHGSDKLNYRIANNQAEATVLTLKVAKTTNDSEDDARLVVLGDLLNDITEIIDAENTAATLINSMTNKDRVDTVTVIWPT